MFGFAKKLFGDIGNEVAKYNNAAFAEAAISAAALVAWADGVLAAEEKSKLAKFIDTNPALAAFDRAKLAQTFKSYSDQIEFDFGMGKDAVFATVKKVTDPAQRVLVVRLAVAIAKSDEAGMEPPEEKVIRQLCQVLGLEAGEFIAP